MRFEYIKEKRWIRLLFFAFCAVVFLLAAFVIAHCDSFTTGIWFPTSTNSDEVIYNRQLVGVLKVGSPQGYFGYNESHAVIGTFSTWGPLVIWLYAIPGFLFGAGYNTMFWCNLFFCCAGLGRAGRPYEQETAACLCGCAALPVDTAAADFYSNVGAAAFLFVSLRGQRLTGSGKEQQKG